MPTKKNTAATATSDISPRLIGDRSVRVHVSPDEIYSLAKISDLKAKVLGQLGCPACHSGFDIGFETAVRDFAVSARGAVTAVSPAKVARLPHTLNSPDTSVRVQVNPDQLFNLGTMNELTKSVLGRLGCPACHSGFDIRFTHVRDFVVDAKLNVKALDTSTR